MSRTKKSKKCSIQKVLPRTDAKVKQEFDSNYILYQSDINELSTYVIGLNSQKILLDNLDLSQVVVRITLDQIDKILKDKTIKFVEYYIVMFTHTKKGVKQRVLNSSIVHYDNRWTKSNIAEIFHKLDETYQDYVADTIEVKILKHR